MGFGVKNASNRGRALELPIAALFIQILLEIVNAIPVYLLSCLKMIHFTLGGDRSVLEVELYLDRLDLSLVAVEVYFETFGI
jgi:hypothetical protein